MTKVHLYCKFPNRDVAMQVAEALRAANFPNPLPEDWVAPEPLETFPSDGWLGGYYYNIDVLFGNGEVWLPVGEPDENGIQQTELQEGYHINGIWHGPEETVPAVLSQFRIYPDNPVCVFG